MKKWFVLASATAGAAVFVAVLAGKDDIRRFWLIHNMYYICLFAVSNRLVVLR